MIIIHEYDENMVLTRPRVHEGGELPPNTTDVDLPEPEQSPYWEKYQIGFLKYTFDKKKNVWYEGATEEDAARYLDDVSKQREKNRLNNDFYILGSQLVQQQIENMQKDQLINEMGTQMVDMQIQLLKLQQGGIK
jgi:hypothetical protein